MNTTAIIIIASIITLLSLLLKFLKLGMENISIFFNIRQKSNNIMRFILRQEKIGDFTSPVYKHFRLAISDWFSAIAIAIVSYTLVSESVSLEMLTRKTVLHISLLFSLLLFNIIFLGISIIERRLGYWIEEFMTIVEHIFELIRLNRKEDVKRPRIFPTRAPAKKKRKTRSGKK